VADEAIGVIADGLKGVRELFNSVREIGPPADAPPQAEKHGAAAKKGLVVVADFLGEQWFELREESTFASRPFEKRAHTRF
jgi:hypothetical protein